MTPEELKIYYTNLLIIQFANKVNALGTIGAFASQLIADLIYNTVRAAFSITDAVGVQLDIMGQYRGAQRTIYGLSPDKDFFSMPSINANPNAYFGFGTYAIADLISWYFMTLSDADSNNFTLTDDEMRQLILYLAAVQSSPTTLEKIDTIIDEFFGQYVTLTDNENMSITYTHSSLDPSQFFRYVKNLGVLPRPAGVSLTVVEV